MATYMYIHVRLQLALALAIQSLETNYAAVTKNQDGLKLLVNLV